uniref:Uncharacterized protein n=1 Tax=Schistosoma haematobium TaxID=6185 RepID=A0A095A0Q4_SCHHA
MNKKKSICKKMTVNKEAMENNLFLSVLGLTTKWCNEEEEEIQLNNNNNNIGINNI